MKLELVNINYSADDEVSPITAEIYIDAAHVGQVVNYRPNEHTDHTTVEYYAIDKQSLELLNKADIYFRKLPPITFPPRFGREGVVWESNLFNRIKEVFVNFFDEKDAQKFREIVDKQQYNAIVVGNRDDGHTTIATSRPIHIMLMGEPGTVYLQWQLQMIREQMIDMELNGKLILNTNIPENILKNAGYLQGEYVKPDIAMHWLEERKIAEFRERLKPGSNAKKKKQGKRM